MRIQEAIMARKKDGARSKAFIPPSQQGVGPATVPSPTVLLAVEHVSRRASSVDQMFARKQMTREEHRAAVQLLNAYETIIGQTGGVMDFERTRGSGGTGGGIPAVVIATEILRDAKEKLYRADYRIVTLVCCEGRSIEQAIEAINHREPTRAQREDVGRRLRAGLRELADYWFGSERKAKEGEIVGFAAPDTPYAAVPGTISRGKVIHATGTRIFRSK